MMNWNLSSQDVNTLLEHLFFLSSRQENLKSVHFYVANASYAGKFSSTALNFTFRPGQVFHR